jgi:hypothetical protein
VQAAADLQEGEWGSRDFGFPPEVKEASSLLTISTMLAPLASVLWAIVLLKLVSMLEKKYR